MPQATRYTLLCLLGLSFAAAQTLSPAQTTLTSAQETRAQATLTSAQETRAQTTLTSAQETRAQAIGRTIRCPVCQGLPITESPSELSQSMLRDLRGQVAAGRSDDQISGYFAARYGDTVLLDPPRRGVNLLLWIGPLLALLLGASWLLSYLRRERGTAVVPESAEAPPEESDEYLERVRAELARERGTA